MTDDDRPDDYGPSGYLPERASKRARKIVLRAPLGLQWVVAAGVFGAAVLVAGILWLRSGGPPDPPFVATVPLAEADAVAEPLPAVDALLVTVAIPPVTFAGVGSDELTWCDDERRFVDGSGGVWGPDGRGYGVDSLDRHPVVVHEGTVYVDPTRTRPGPAPGPAPPAPVQC